MHEESLGASESDGEDNRPIGQSRRESSGVVSHWVEEGWALKPQLQLSEGKTQMNKNDGRKQRAKGEKKNRKQSKRNKKGQAHLASSSPLPRRVFGLVAELQQH